MYIFFAILAVSMFLFIKEHLFNMSYAERKKYIVNGNFSNFKPWKNYRDFTLILPILVWGIGMCFLISNNN